MKPKGMFTLWPYYYQSLEEKAILRLFNILMSFEVIAGYEVIDYHGSDYIEIYVR